MDKNNDIKVNKISKWEAAPKNMGTLFTYINLVIGMACSLPSEIRDNLYDLMDKTLDEYDELEVVHHKECGMISQYEEENRNLKSELDIKTDECDALTSRLFKQDEEYTNLKEENKELRETRELLNEVNLKQCNEVDELEADIRDLEVQVQVNKGIASLYESEIKQIIDLAKSYGLIIYDDRKDAISDDVKNIGMCGHYYVLDSDIKNENDRLRNIITKYEKENRRLRDQRNGLKIARIKLANYNDHLRQERDRHIDLLDKLRWALEDKGIRVEWNEAALKWNLYDKTNTTCESCRKHYEEELRIRCEEINNKDKLIDELKQKIEDLEYKNRKDIAYGYFSLIASLREKLETLEKENKELKDTIEKDGEFGRNVGECVADSIREGCNKGVYWLDPCTRIDIHVEETNSMPINMPFGRYAIPRISVIFNNTQTEMERDTAQHECEELEKKFKELVKENEDLRTTFEMCERDANMTKNLCDNIAFNAERAKNKTPWFNE